MRKKIIISSVLVLSSLILLIGAIAFTTVDNANKKERKYLLEKGVKTTAVIKSKSREVNRQMSPQTYRWLYIYDYFITYSFFHDGIERNDKAKSFEDYLNKVEESKPKAEDKITLTNLTDKPIYETQKIGSKIQIIYIYGQPNSARILNSRGGVTIPNLFIFACISAILFLLNTFILFYFIKTGKTF